jgi:cobaltochelatase CobS
MNITDLQQFAASIKSKAPTTGPGELEVDPFFVEDPIATVMVEYSIKNRKNLLIYGATGTGKSSLAINVMARLKERCEIFSCSGETSKDELEAAVWYDGTTMKALYGAVLRAYSEGKGLLLEEVDIANPEVLAALHRVLETQSKFVTVNVGGIGTVPRHKDFFVIATANSIGCGENAFDYAGTKPLNKAFVNRFTYTIKLDYIAPLHEKKVVCDKTGIPFVTAEKMVYVANDARDAHDPTRKAGAAIGSERLASTVSTRDVIHWAELVRDTGMTPLQAAEYTFILRSDPNDREILSRFVTNRF